MMTSRGCLRRFLNLRRRRPKFSFIWTWLRKSQMKCKTLTTTLWSSLSSSKPSYLELMIRVSQCLITSSPRNLPRYLSRLGDKKTDCAYWRLTYCATQSQTQTSRLLWAWSKARRKKTSWSLSDSITQLKLARSLNDACQLYQTLSSLSTSASTLKRFRRCMISLGHNLRLSRLLETVWTKPLTLKAFRSLATRSNSKALETLNGPREILTKLRNAWSFVWLVVLHTMRSVVCRTWRRLPAHRIWS